MIKKSKQLVTAILVFTLIVVLTNMSRIEFLNNAISHAGMTEGSSAYYNMINTYNSQSGYTADSDWCAEFASYIAIISGEKSHFSMVNYSYGQYLDLVDQGKTILTKSQYIAKYDGTNLNSLFPCMSYDYDTTAPSNTIPNHMGIVVDYNPVSGEITTVEGNITVNGGTPQAYKATYNISNTRFRYFYIPPSWSVDSYEWNAKATGGYSLGSSEALTNAQIIYKILNQQGWALNAVCGLLGNFQVESGLNPWRWQSDNILSYANADTVHVGYGLGQFTPASKYMWDSRAQGLTGYNPHTSDREGNSSDGTAQILFINSYADYIATSTYPYSYSEFKVLTLAPSEMARIWLYNYERPANPTASIGDRVNYAEAWYDLLKSYDPDTPIISTTFKHKFKPWLMYSAVRRHR